MTANQPSAAPLPARSPAALAFGTSRVILRAFLAACLAVALIEALSLGFPGKIHRDDRMADWYAFHIAGQLTSEGRAAANYDFTALQAEQIARTGKQAFMPWAYPPPFTLATAPLALLPAAWSYLATQLALLGWFLWTVRRAAGAHLPAALAAAMPAMITNIACGQNGFLTGALIGSFLLALHEGAPRGGWRPGTALGAMLIKPHLAVAIALLALLERRWKALALAAGITLAASAVTTLALGPAIWTAFLGATRAATVFLWAGDYPMERMSSLYACLARFGVAPGPAMALHGAAALAALAMLVQAWRHKMPRAWLLALAGAVSLLISPYAYDYDMPLLAVLAALVWPGLLARADGREIAGLFALAWLACGNGLWVMAWQITHPGASDSAVMSLSAPALIALIAACALVLRRPVSAAVSANPPPHPAAG